MTPGQGPLDAVLLVAEPVQRGVDLAFCDDTQVQHATQAGGRRLGGQRPHGRQFGAWRDQAARDHRQRQIALARDGTAEQARQIKLAHHADHRGDVTMWQSALDFVHLFRPHDGRTALQQHAQTVDHRRRQLAQVGERALPDLAALAKALSQKHRWRRPTVRDHVDEHGRIESRRIASTQARRMDTFGRITMRLTVVPQSETGLSQ